MDRCEFVIRNVNNVHIVFKEKKQEMRLSVSMMQAFPCSYFLRKIMSCPRLGTTTRQERKSVEWKQKQQLGKDRLPALGRWREQEVM